MWIWGAVFAVAVFGVFRSWKEDKPCGCVVAAAIAAFASLVVGIGLLDYVDRTYYG